MSKTHAKLKPITADDFATAFSAFESADKMYDGFGKDPAPLFTRLCIARDMAIKCSPKPMQKAFKRLQKEATSLENPDGPTEKELCKELNKQLQAQMAACVNASPKALRKKVQKAMDACMRANYHYPNQETRESRQGYVCLMVDMLDDNGYKYEMMGHEDIELKTDEGETWALLSAGRNPEQWELVPLTHLGDYDVKGSLEQIEITFWGCDDECVRFNLELAKDLVKHAKERSDVIHDIVKD